MVNSLIEFVAAMYVGAPAASHAFNWQLAVNIAQLAVNIAYTIVTFLILIVAVFQDHLRRRFFQPKYEISVRDEPPWSAVVEDEYKLQTGREAYVMGYFLRIRVVNTGGMAAKDAEIFVNEIMQKKDSATEKWEKKKNFIGMNLVWAYNHQVTAVLPEKIPKFCDLGWVHDPTGRSHFPDIYPPDWQKDDKTVFCLAVHHRAKSRSYLLPAGCYRLWLTLGASNSRSREIYIDFKLNGEWAKDQKGVNVKIEEVGRRRR
jgi:hypothetical protein